VRVLLCSVLILLYSNFTFAQQPFYTDNADVTPAGQVHVEVFGERDWLQRGQDPHIRQNTFNMRIDYGLGKGFEVDFDSPFITIANDSTTSLRGAAGIGDTNFGVKYNFHQEDGRLPALSLAAYIETPTGNPNNGLGSGLTDTWIYGIVQKTVAPAWIARFNAGYLFTGNTSTGVVGISKARGHVATLNASLVRTITRRFDLGAEVSSAIAPNTDLQRAQLQFMVGGNYAIHERFTLDIGVLGGRFVASPRIGLQIGFSFD